MAEGNNNHFDYACKDFVVQAAGKRMFSDALVVLKMMTVDEIKVPALDCMANAATDKNTLDVVIASAASMPLADKKKLHLSFISAMARLGLGYDESLGSNSISSVLGILDSESDKANALGSLLEAYAAQGHRDQFFAVAKVLDRPIKDEEIGKLINGIQQKRAQDEADRAGQK